MSRWIHLPNDVADAYASIDEIWRPSLTNEYSSETIATMRVLVLTTRRKYVEGDACLTLARPRQGQGGVSG